MTAEDQPIEERAERVPQRVIGTPATDSPMLGAPETPEAEYVPPEGVKPADERQARRAERKVVLCFGITSLSVVAFVYFYVTFQVGSTQATGLSNFALGLSLMVAVLTLAIGIVLWARQIMPKYTLTQDRHPMLSEEEDREAVAEYFVQGANESGFVRRKVLRRALLPAAAALGVVPIVLLRDLDNTKTAAANTPDRLRHTVWGEKTKEGKPPRLIIEGSGRPIRAADFNTPGGLLSVVPEGHEHDLDALAKATVILINLRPEEIKSGTNQNWMHNGIVAYSKICTHVGCPAALYEQNTHHILCPCHQSTFDATDGARVVFGPAARALPQLPITVDAEGYLIAKGDFAVPVGPSFWERGDAEAKANTQGGGS
ncbi:(2Fe-2S)-binding protein [Spongiactinospora gelatinilytica]|uniref:Cytochrome bc1 complex Rieske iron-sulfur subunit n=1 Tax=Spongiactinospora gelatinilytica TaxID=2666298 RepID=A0A2W2FQD8_9ACTN|nr:Rieske 2Fe-2S domain-containing protein [Spongiactinospora gelatinilytica]PZG37933.1 (2Fe-2S)-binding protein [Spongiactinospora gelatinilytica]